MVKQIEKAFCSAALLSGGSQILVLSSVLFLHVPPYGPAGGDLLRTLAHALKAAPNKKVSRVLWPSES